MSWIQLRLSANRESASALEDALMEIGAAAVTMEDGADQPVFEPGVGERPVWDSTRVTGLFSADADTDALLVALAASYTAPLPPLKVEILEDRDWIREWMDSYQPIQCGERLWICPSWREPTDANAVNLMLDPGLAFGTGTHPTTFLCLQWLDQQDLTGKTVIDYGCGSGILGIAALLLGAEKMIAVDNDPQALIATRDNAQRNNIAPERVECFLPTQIPENLSGDAVVANILAGPLLELAPQLAGYLAPATPICLSGILHTQGDLLSERYSEWFTDIDRAQREEWLRITGQRKAG
ncbi:50S ribosomal protein L11 methyltransferase [Spongiibacter sp. KMU-158]|uniref:Ribosomal protein L11 methyltransferase n=1 Tax=Spongiibacter pelagi TaxID=2760804 RepID=A0A927BZU9_9GAMM|nr:50S ribosomal protein L11 methyltransferase [Spongiibacter pelagi]MBD2858643.1 50S ribosomal protein L11 methyltransferase [Spongiibacter pelagi]